MVIADADVWVDYFEKPSSRTGELLDRLIRAGQAALTGVVLAELVRGAQGRARLRALRDIFAGMPYLEMNRGAWERAGRIAEELDRKGTIIPLPDIFIAALAIEGEHELLTRDKHFDRIPGLRLYQPEGDTP